MRIRLRFLVMVCLLFPLTLWAADDEAVKQRVAQMLKTVAPDVSLDDLRPSPIPGLYEATIGAQVLYFSADGRYMFQGELVDLQERRSLTEPRRQSRRVALIKDISDKDTLIYPAKGEKKQTITVFTDIDCGYCRRLHQHMADMNERGIEVRYLMMPRAGLDSPSYRKAVAVWCSDNPREALTQAKLGKDIPFKDCTNPVRDHMALADELGVTATPTMVTNTGAVWPGYLPPDELQARLESEDAKAQQAK